MGSTDKSRDPASLFQLLASFTNDGTPLEALLGSKVEWGVTVLTAGMLANENLAASMSPEEMVYKLHTYSHPKVGTEFPPFA